MGSSDEDEITVQDGDSCSLEELNRIFKSPLHLSTEEAISLQKNYILHLDTSRLVCYSKFMFEKPFLKLVFVVFIFFLAPLTRW